VSLQPYILEVPRDISSWVIPTEGFLVFEFRMLTSQQSHHGNAAAIGELKEQLRRKDLTKKHRIELFHKLFEWCVAHICHIRIYTYIIHAQHRTLLSHKLVE
jgi:hypothetical protein